MIAIVDYGMGNLHSVEKAFAHLGVPSVITDRADEIERAGHVVLPGVGAFGDACDRLREKALMEVLARRAGDGRPFLGICLGMQLLFAGSEEAPGVPGLGLFPGIFQKFPKEAGKVPHMGWNSLVCEPDCPLFAGLPAGVEMYFVHSFALYERTHAVAETEYGGVFYSAAGRGGLYGVQFHPEKSGRAGLALLRNFARWEGTPC
ncbi:MAG: imidazole glycerol phosphate synthase subunit HisH [Oscillospiraceae bacterium]|nr:imidazole glycerol phosphate synthase subunit HisH [Oscillospiraceae bacterium]